MCSYAPEQHSRTRLYQCHFLFKLEGALFGRGDLHFKQNHFLGWAFMGGDALGLAMPEQEAPAHSIGLLHVALHCHHSQALARMLTSMTTLNSEPALAKHGTYCQHIAGYVHVALFVHMPVWVAPEKTHSHSSAKQTGWGVGMGACILHSIEGPPWRNECELLEKSHPGPH